MRDPHLENRERAGVATNEKVLGNFLIARISLNWHACAMGMLSSL